MSTIGADMGQLESLKGTFDQKASVVADLRAAISSQLSGTQWQGPAADRFRNSWSSDFAPSLQRLEEALQEASAEIQRRHEALLQAGS